MNRQNQQFDTTRQQENQISNYFNQSNKQSFSENKFKGQSQKSDQGRRISKISATRSNISKLTSNQTQQRNLLQGQYGIRNLTPTRSRSKIKQPAKVPRGDISPDEADFRTPNENIHSYFVPKTDPQAQRKMSEQISISGIQDVMELKRKLLNNQHHHQMIQQNIVEDKPTSNVRIVTRKDKQPSKKFRPFGFDIGGMFSQQHSISNLNDNYSQNEHLISEGNENNNIRAKQPGQAYNNFTNLARNINRESLKSEHYNDYEPPLAQFGKPSSPETKKDQNYFGNMLPQFNAGSPNTQIRESKEFYNQQVESIQKKEIQNEQKPLDISLNLSDRAKMETLQKLSNQLNDLNSNLMLKLNDKIQMNFEKELATIRSVSGMNKSQVSRVSSNSRGRPMTPVRGGTPRAMNRTMTRSDGSGSKMRTTLLSGLTFDDLSQMDISENDIIAQSKQADLKIQLLQKQITLLEQRAKLETLADRIATEENPIDIQALGRQSNKDHHEQNLYNDLLGQDNKEDQANLINNNGLYPGSINNSIQERKEVQQQINEVIAPSHREEGEEQRQEKETENNEIRSLIQNLPVYSGKDTEEAKIEEQKKKKSNLVIMTNKEGDDNDDDNIPECESTPRDDTNQVPNQQSNAEIEALQEEDNDQKYLDKIVDQRLNSVHASGDSMVKLAKDFERQKNEEELQELISIESKKSKMTENHGIRSNVNDKYFENDHSESTQRKRDVAIAQNNKIDETIRTNEAPKNQHHGSFVQQQQQSSDRGDVNVRIESQISGSHDMLSQAASYIDSQYIDQLTLLKSLLSSDKSTAFYSNQCQIFIGCHQTYLKQRDAYIKMKNRGENLQIPPPKPEIPCERIVGGLNMMRQAIKNGFESLQNKGMLASQIDMQFYMVISLFEAFQNQQEEEEAEYKSQKQNSVTNNTQYFNKNKLTQVSNSQSYSVKSAGMKSIRGLNSEHSFKQSNYEKIMKNNGYDQTIYKNNASEQGEMAPKNSRAVAANKANQDVNQANYELNNSIGNQSMMSQPISNKVLFVGVGALDSPRMDDYGDEEVKKSNQQQPIKESVNLGEQIVSKSSKQSLMMDQRSSKPSKMSSKYSHEQSNRKIEVNTNLKASNENIEVSISPMHHKQMVQDSIDKVSIPKNMNQVIHQQSSASKASGSIKESKNTSVFQSMASQQHLDVEPYVSKKNNQHVNNSISLSNHNYNQKQNKQSLNQSMRSLSKLSAHDRLQNAKGKLNSRLEKEAEKMSSQAPSIARSIKVKQIVNVPDNASALRRQNSPNLFSKKNDANGDDMSKSKSRSRSRVNLFQRDQSQGNAGNASARGALSVGPVSNYSDFGNQNIITFKEFTKMSNNILKKHFAKEQYAQLVSIPSMYKKMCQQLLQGLEQDISKGDLDDKVTEFIKIEYRKQIQSYKLQFQEPMSERITPQPNLPIVDEDQLGNESSAKEMESQKWAMADQIGGGHGRKNSMIQNLANNEFEIDKQKAQLTLGKETETASSQLQQQSPPAKSTKRNLFGNKNPDQDNSTSKKSTTRAHLLDNMNKQREQSKQEQVDIPKLNLQRSDEKDIHLILEEFDKSEKFKGSQSSNQNNNQDNGTPRFKNRKANLPNQNSIVNIPAPVNNRAQDKSDPYARSSKAQYMKLIEKSISTKMHDTASHERSNSNRSGSKLKTSARQVKKEDIANDVNRNPFKKKY